MAFKLNHAIDSFVLTSSCAEPASELDVRVEGLLRSFLCTDPALGMRMSFQSPRNMRELSKVLASQRIPPANTPPCTPAFWYVCCSPQTVSLAIGDSR